MIRFFREGKEAERDTMISPVNHSPRSLDPTPHKIRWSYDFVPPCLRGSIDACSQQKFLNNSGWALRGRNDDFSVGSLKKYNGTVTALQRHGGVMRTSNTSGGFS